MYYLDRDPDGQFAGLISPTATSVKLFYGADRRIEVTLAKDGRIVGWERVEPKPATPIVLSPAESRAKAEDALEALTGTSRALFASENSATNQNSSQLTWEMKLPSEPRVKLTAVIDIDNGIVKKASLNPTFTATYLDGIRAERRVLNAFTIAWPMLLLLGLILGLVYYLLNIVRKEVSHRSTLVLLGGIFLLITVWSLSGDFFDDIYSGLSTAPQLQRFYLSAVLAWLIVSLLSLVFAVPFFLIWGAGYPFSAAQRPNRLRGLEVLLRGRVLSKVTGTNLFAGIALGWLIPAVMLLVGGGGLFYNSHFRGPDALSEMLTSRFPLLTPPTETAVIASYTFFLLYVLFVPLASTLMRRPLASRALAVLVGSVCLIGPVSFQSSLSASWVCAAILMLILDRLTFRFDLLTALTALLAGDFALKLSALGAQPAPGLQWSALTGWLLLAAMGCIGGYIALRGRELDDSQTNPLWTTEEQRANRVDRERLRAEFDVARRAQEQMLPNQSPEFPGIEISSVCRPAREVGGDLYDFLYLPDDRLGIVVADVSGKGVPASLYMTLTKGLLASVAEATSDPGEMLREVNRHLYVACGKKMFVTLLLGVVDPVERTFSYARAGHNPPVWRQATAQRTTLLRARGLGLGLNSGDVFNRALAVETIRLASNDKLVLYSDGITEAMNEDRIEYGEERLMELTARSDALNAEELREAILKDVSGFLGPTPPQDDQTLVVVQVR